MNQYIFEDIKRKLLKCITEYNCEVEMRVKFTDNENEHYPAGSRGYRKNPGREKALPAGENGRGYYVGSKVCDEVEVWIYIM